MQEKVGYPNQPNGHANGDVFSSQDKKALEANGLLGSALEKSLEANGHLICIQDKKAAEANGDAGVHKRVSIFMGDVEIEEDDPWALPELKDDTAKWKGTFVGVRMDTFGKASLENSTKYNLKCSHIEENKYSPYWSLNIQRIGLLLSM
ncbi:hypothetical protein BgiMline_018851 [Biomphalaria glabrata]